MGMWFLISLPVPGSQKAFSAHPWRVWWVTKVWWCMIPTIMSQFRVQCDIFWQQLATMVGWCMSQFRVQCDVYIHIYLAHLSLRYNTLHWCCYYWQVLVYSKLAESATASFVSRHWMVFLHRLPWKHPLFSLYLVKVPLAPRVEAEDCCQLWLWLMTHLPEQDLQDLRHRIRQMRVHDSELLQIEVLPPFWATTTLQLLVLLCV